MEPVKAGAGHFECFARDPLRALVGPTGAGKSELALALAERAGVEILSLDSMQVYRGMDIGTAKPTRADRERVRHHLLDLVEPHEEFDVPHYLAAAEQALGDVRDRNQRALFVGGTGFYLKALTHGMFAGPPADPKLRAELVERYRREGGAALHAELARTDPQTAARVHPNDEKRVVRALEVERQTGRPISDWQGQWRSGEGPAAGAPRRLIGLDWPVSELDRRIELRTREMLGAGWAEEAARIESEQGWSKTSGQALGYGIAAQLCGDKLTAAQAEQQIVGATRRFARRQRTWFRKFPEIVWLDPRKSLADQVDEALVALDWKSDYSA